MASWRNKWSIGIFVGTDPLDVSSPAGVTNPVMTAETVTDVLARSVADPFLLRRGDRWYLFFEVWNGDRELGEIAYATSDDGFSWAYGEIVLREPFHLSYPQVFTWRGRIYMVPESRAAGAVILYRALEFPRRWKAVARLTEGLYADATVFRRDGRWWMFAQRGLDELRLLTSESLEAGWREHPQSPLYAGNRRVTRPGGRVLELNGRLIRFAQDGLPSYGNRLRAFAIDRLDEAGYAEHEVDESPVLEASRQGWNAAGMHHLDAHRLPDGRWLAAVDGASIAHY